MLLSHELAHYGAAIRTLPEGGAWTRAELLIDALRMERRDDVEIYYAPHNEWLNPEASVMIVGITPGWAQMKTACETARRGLEGGLPHERICEEAKRAAGLSGPMRANLVPMLDRLGLPLALGIPSCDSLFGAHRALLHTTSLLRFPVFVAGRNYTGSQPPLPTSDWLRETALASIREELRLLRPKLIVPLGKTVEALLRLLRADELPAGARLLLGFPHPSGANGHRHRQFAEAEAAMRRTVAEAFGREPAR